MNGPLLKKKTDEEIRGEKEKTGYRAAFFTPASVLLGGSS